MERECIKRYVKKDGSERISFYQEDYACSPREMTDEPLHCEDWSRDYSIMTKQDRESKSSSARDLLAYMIENYVDYKKIIDFLVENGKHMSDGNCKSNDALVYNKPEHRWDLMSDMLHYNFATKKNEMGWCLNNHYYEKKYYIDICGLLDDVCDSTIDYLVQNFLGDKVKIMSYGFGYNGDISFYRDFSTDSEGICWLEKEEFLKYSGCKEEYWKNNSLDEIEFLLKEIEDWSEGNVYGYVVEKGTTYEMTKVCKTEVKPDETYEETEWEYEDGCAGFYGEFEKIKGDMFVEAGLNEDEFDEV